MEATVSTKLQEKFKEITTALESLTEAVKRSPKEIIGISKIIEKGEKTISKEHAKRIEELKTIQHEIEAITEFASKMGYTLTDTETEEPEETEQQEEPEQPEEPKQPEPQPTNGIKIVIGDKHNDNTK